MILSSTRTSSWGTGSRVSTMSGGRSMDVSCTGTSWPPATSTKPNCGARLTERLGVRWQPVRNGMADIEGFTREQIMAFSQRRQQIEAWRNAHGLADTAAANEVATLATRSPKQDHPIDMLMPAWLERGTEVGVTPESVATVLERSRSVTVPDPAPVFESMASAEGLTAQASTFGRADAIRAVAEALPEGGRRADIEHLADAFLRRSDVIPILPIHPTTDPLSHLSIDLEPAELEHLLELVNSTQPRIMRQRQRGHLPRTGQRTPLHNHRTPHHRTTDHRPRPERNRSRTVDRP